MCSCWGRLLPITRARAHAGFTCSAGVACNKLLAKVASALNKPNQQTVVPPRRAPRHRCPRRPGH